MHWPCLPCKWGGLHNSKVHVVLKYDSIMLWEKQMSTSGNWQFIVADIHHPIGTWYIISAHAEARYAELIVWRTFLKISHNNNLLTATTLLRLTLHSKLLFHQSSTRYSDWTMTVQSLLTTVGSTMTELPSAMYSPCCQQLAAVTALLLSSHHVVTV